MGGEVRTKDILLSRTLADILLLGVGDKVDMLFVEPGEMPRLNGAVLMAEAYYQLGETAKADEMMTVSYTHLFIAPLRDIQCCIIINLIIKTDY